MLPIKEDAVSQRHAAKPSSASTSNNALMALAPPLLQAKRDTTTKTPLYE